MGLHVELAADAWVAVDDDVADAELLQLFAAGQPGGAGTYDGHRGLVDLQSVGFLLALRWLKGHSRKVGLVSYDAHLVHAVDRCDADAAHAAVDQHLAGSAFAYAAFERTVAAAQRMAVHGVASLVQRFGDGVAFVALNFVSFKHEFDNLGFGDVQNRMGGDSVHLFKCFRINVLYSVSCSMWIVQRYTESLRIATFFFNL